MSDDFAIYMDDALKRQSKILNNFPTSRCGIELISSSLLIECQHGNELLNLYRTSGVNITVSSLMSMLRFSDSFTSIIT